MQAVAAGAGRWQVEDLALVLRAAVAELYGLAI